MLTAGLLAFVAVGIFYGQTNAAPAPKVDVCHATGSGSYKKISISENAVQKHVDNHGDFLALNGTSFVNGDELVVAEDCTAWRLVETVSVSSEDRNTVASSSAALENGETYKLRAYGTFTYTGNQWADAEWYLKSGEAVKGDTEGSVAHVLDTTIDGDFTTDWGTYSEDHVYIKDYLGAGLPVQFSIYDSNHSDNSGGISVDIYEQL